MPADPFNDTRDALFVDRQDGAPEHAPHFDGCDAPVKRTVAAPPRRKRAAAPTFDDGAKTRVFKFPSRTYPKSSYYVTDTEIIVRIKKARKKWKLVVPKKRVVSYRTNRWFAKPRWIEIELTYTQAVRHGFAEVRTVPRGTGSSGACASPQTGGDSIAEADLAVTAATLEEDLCQLPEADVGAATASEGDDVRSLDFSPAEAPVNDELTDRDTTDDEADAADAIEEEYDTTDDTAVGVERESDHLDEQSDPEMPDAPAPVSLLDEDKPSSHRDILLDDETGHQPSIDWTTPAAFDPDQPSPKRSVVSAVLGASAMAVALLASSAAWWPTATENSRDGLLMARSDEAGVSGPRDSLSGPHSLVQRATAEAGVDPIDAVEIAAAVPSPVAEPRAAADQFIVTGSTSHPAVASEGGVAAAPRETDTLMKHDAGDRFVDEVVIALQDQEMEASKEIPGGSRQSDGPSNTEMSEAAPAGKVQPMQTQPMLASAEPSRAAAVQTCREAAVAAVDAMSFHFGFASSRLDQKSVAALSQFATSLDQCPETRIIIEGHTDSDGHVERNQLLSRRRAEAVRQVLVAAGLAQDQLSVVGFGQMRPVVPNDTRANKQQNRRIRLVVEQPR